MMENKKIDVGIIFDKKIRMWKMDKYIYNLMKNNSKYIMEKK